MWKDTAYGFVMPADAALFWLRNPGKWEQLILDKAGVTRTIFTEDHAEMNRRIEAYRAASKAALEVTGCQLRQCGNSIVVVGYILGEDSTDFKYIENIDPVEMIKRGEETNPRLRAFCEVLGIEYHEPEWLQIRTTQRA